MIFSEVGITTCYFHFFSFFFILFLFETGSHRPGAQPSGLDAWLVSPRDQPTSAGIPGILPCWVFLCGFQETNSVPYACQANTLLKHPTFQLPFWSPRAGHGSEQCMAQSRLHVYLGQWEFVRLGLMLSGHDCLALMKLWVQTPTSTTVNQLWWSTLVILKIKVIP